jgi:hypothetical protein
MVMSEGPMALSSVLLVALWARSEEGVSGPLLLHNSGRISDN